MIDSPIVRFRANDMAAARERLAEVFGEDSRAYVRDVASQPSPAVSPELRAALARAAQLLTDAGAAKEHVPEEDQADLSRLADDLAAAVRELSVDKLTQAWSQLDDLLFYLKDA
jgi:hypothetical protein